MNSDAVIHKYFLCSHQTLLDWLLVIYAIVVICGVLLALQFPVVISSPVAALAFAFLTTASLGTVATIVGGTFAPLSMFALILVSNSMDLLI